jgi:transposase, IS5 family
LGGRGLGPGNAIPDANTLWDFREALIARFDRAITEAAICL